MQLVRKENQMTETKAEDLCETAFALSCHEQFRLATLVAENVGYVLVAETEQRLAPDVIWIDGERYKLIKEEYPG